jgi:uncharacterized protein (UPF0332 family)
MSKKYAPEIAANLERAEESLNAAKELLLKGYPDVVASRAYYTAFYAATALLLCEEMTFRKHTAVISFIHKNFVKTGKLAAQFGKDLNWLFELRSVSDYGVTVRVPQKNAEQAVKTAEEFLQAIKDLIVTSE